MTREEAIKRIQDFIGWFKKDSDIYEALEMAIQALSQEPCDDAVSREAVIEWLENATYEDVSYAVGTELSFLPPVTQKSVFDEITAEIYEEFMTIDGGVHDTSAIKCMEIIGKYRGDKE